MQTDRLPTKEGGPGLGVGSHTVKSKLNKFEHVRRGGSLCGDVQCMDKGHMGFPMNRQTHMTETITFPQLRWRAVIMHIFSPGTYLLKLKF